MARSKGKKRAEPRGGAVPEPPGKSEVEPPSAGGPILPARRIVAVALMAAFLGSVAAYFVPPRGGMREAGVPAWQQTNAMRLWRAVRLWGMSRDAKRLAASEGHMGGAVFGFTQEWSKYLDEHLMPQTKFADFTREEHIRYLLPNTNRRTIPPPPGQDPRPAVLVGYGLTPEQLEPSQLWAQVKHSGTITLESGHTIGQSFVTRFDYDRIDVVALFVPPDTDVPEEGYNCVLYSSPDRERELGRADVVVFGRVRFEGKNGSEGGSLRALQFGFIEPPGTARLGYNRGAWPYLIEVSWQRPEGYDGPAPTFCYVDRDALPYGQMYVDGKPYAPGGKDGVCDLAFGVRATYTDVQGYMWIIGYGQPASEKAWPPYFLAVRQDVLEMTGRMIPGETLEHFFERLNEVLLKL